MAPDDLRARGDNLTAQHWTPVIVMSLADPPRPPVTERPEAGIERLEMLQVFGLDRRGLGVVERHDAAEQVIELIGLYWHFVDIVWIVIFTLVYLIPA